MQKEFGARLTVCTRWPARRMPVKEDALRARRWNMAVRDDLARLQQRFGTEAELAIEAGDPPKVVCEMAESRQGGVAGDRARVGGGRVWPAADQCVRHYPAVAVSRGECVGRILAEMPADCIRYPA
jgi:hypothetical protein